MKLYTRARPLGLLRTICYVTGLTLFAASPSTLAVDDLGLFELDGNAVDNSGGPAPDDWSTLFNDNDPPAGSSTVFTGVNADPAPQSIFDGGKKDIQDISEWSHKSGAVPDKSDITNAYAAAYQDNGDLILYFGADRLTNVGDTFLGFWFFKSEVTANPNGSFSGTHQPGDTLVLVNFPQANNAVPLIQVVVWDPACSKAANNNPQPGQCAAANLRLVAGASGAGAICGSSSDDNACAITNLEGTANAAPGADSTAPWDYTSKDGVTGQFPFETFFEGGINLTQLIGGDSCFSSFMAESRSSSSFTASLKDFVLDAFPLCAVSVSKSCTNARLNDAGDMIVYDITGDVTNGGFGTVYDIAVTDDPAFDAGTLDFDADPASLDAGQDLGYSATITVPFDQNGRMDTVTATASTSPGGAGTVLTATATATCPPLQISPALQVTKNCVSSVMVMDAKVVAQVTAAGDVCNIGDSTVTNVTATDDKAGLLFSGVTLVEPDDPADPGATPGACQAYSKTYTPTVAVDSAGDDTTNPAAVIFTDTVTASGTDIFGFPVTPQPVMATCPLCP